MVRPDLYEHFEPATADVSDGIYRVVGCGEDTVTLLRVAGADGQRRHTGEVVTVSLDDFADFAPAQTPDRNRPRGAVLASAVESGYWSVRVFGQQLASNPIATTCAAALVLVGVFGDRVLSFPAIAFSGTLFLGSLCLAYIGSGRLR